MKINPVQNDHDVRAKPCARVGSLPLPDTASPPTSAVFNVSRILVPIDFSSCSEMELQHAVALARQFGSRLFLVFVSQGYYHPAELGPLEAAAEAVRGRADAAGRLAALATQSIPETVPVDLLVRNGEPCAQIINAAKECEADLILIGTHGYTGLKHLWFGSIAENVVRRAPCPVLVVREKPAKKVRNSPIMEKSEPFLGFNI